MATGRSRSAGSVALGGTTSDSTSTTEAPDGVVARLVGRPALPGLKDPRQVKAKVFQAVD